MSSSSHLPRIKRLSSSLANQIAAGEVIERPASVVKELMENSIDAGATRIDIDILRAGTQAISVTDNGHGIHADDLQLALERHATAKISNPEDLIAIHSLGFRGEALPSITSVATLELISRSASSERAVSVYMEPNAVEPLIKPAAHPIGTTVTVSDLFFTTPARKKFLRSERTEFLHVQEMVRRIALSRADISIRLKHNEQMVLNSLAVPDNIDVRMASLVGNSFMKNAIKLDYAAGDMQVWGWFGVAETSRSTTDRQYLFLNSRMIRDKHLNHAIRSACEDRVPEGRFPTYVLYLQMNLEAADVNVHPTKHEVRFRQARDVHDFVYAAIRSVLGEEERLDIDYQEVVSTQAQKIEESKPALYKDAANFSHRPGSSIYNRTAQSDFLNQNEGLGTPLLQILDSFLLTKRNDEILLVNIDEAQKFIATIRCQNVTTETPLKARPLLVPVSFSLDEKQESILSTIKPVLEDFALELELSGPQTCRVRTLPYFLNNADVESLVYDLLNIEMGALENKMCRSTIMKTLLSHVTDIPNASMSGEEMKELLVNLQASGVDVSQSRCSPIWSSLMEMELNKILSDRD